MSFSIRVPSPHPPETCIYLILLVEMSRFSKSCTIRRKIPKIYQGNLPITYQVYTFPSNFKIKLPFHNNNQNELYACFRWVGCRHTYREGHVGCTSPYTCNNILYWICTVDITTLIQTCLIFKSGINLSTLIYNHVANQSVEMGRSACSQQIKSYTSTYHLYIFVNSQLTVGCQYCFIFPCHELYACFRWVGSRHTYREGHVGCTSPYTCNNILYWICTVDITTLIQTCLIFKSGINLSTLIYNHVANQSVEMGRSACSQQIKS
uniref:Putative senescence-associated protein n=1 Tax=Pisum sativum TaxID=3888 RepID=Q9AVH5_PEA|nr:putative senescence-associated protein [Pisum sativum]